MFTSARFSVLILMTALSLSSHVHAAEFLDNFCDTTLHFLVMPAKEKLGDIAIEQPRMAAGWWGRRVNTKHIAYHSDVDIIITDNETADTIWRDSRPVTMGDSGKMEPVALRIPMPRRDATLHVSFDEWLSTRKKGPVVKSYPLKKKMLTTAPLVESFLAHDVVTLREPKNPDRAITIAIIAEGYTWSERDKFLKHAAKADSALFAHAAFRLYADRFRVVAIPLSSSGSGISRPSKDIVVDTPLASHFDSYALDRLITVPQPYKIWKLTEGLPADHIIILANTNDYGGSGSYNDYCISYTGDPYWTKVMVHEFGHSFGHLADEYEDGIGTDEPLNIEPVDPNVTTLVDFKGKWQPLIDSGLASLIEGASYTPKGMWRGCPKCLMRSVTDGDFCNVCTYNLVLTILSLTQE